MIGFEIHEAYESLPFFVQSLTIFLSSVLVS